jgi:hypothetical protein
MYNMEMIENLLWIVTGFIPMLVSMEVAWRIGKRVRCKETAAIPIVK